jgi:V8-like Glu-specific endopeptidase
MRLSSNLLACALAASACAPADLDGLTPSPDYAARHTAIVGGVTDTGDPAVVSLKAGYDIASSQQYCTGTLIAPQTVLTAAHCINAYGASVKYFVVFGTDDSAPTDYRQIVAQYKNPSYTGASGSGHDEGVLKLSSPVLNVTPILPNPVALNSSNVGQSIRHVGFGSTSGAGSGNGLKRQVTYTVRQITTLELESGATGKQTCGGDSGGPALMVTAGSPLERVVGTVSYGDPDCTVYGMDARVDMDLAWIKATYNPWEAPSCATDGKCVAGCTPVDQDCVCVSDGTCNPQCLNLLMDPDCPKDCVANGVCAQAACPTPDPDCVATGAVCSSDLVCKSRDCVSDPQHAGFYCSQSCTLPTDCPSGMECTAAKICLFKQLPVAQVNEVCGPTVWCQGPNTACTGPAGASLRCAFLCTSQPDCPVDYVCEGGVNGTRYCRSPAPPSQPKVKQLTLTLAPAELGATAAGCNAVQGLPSVALALAGLGLVRRRRGGR